MRASRAAVAAEDGRAQPPLDPHYLMTALGENAEHEHRVIGRTMEVLEKPAHRAAAPAARRLTPSTERRTGTFGQVLRDIAPLTRHGLK